MSGDASRSTYEGARILLIEDDHSMAQALQRLLARSGLIVEVCHQLAQVASALAKLQPHLVILDVELPDGNGFDFFEKHLKSRQLPTIFLTCRSSEPERVHGFTIGADDYVTKPFSSQELILRIRRLLKSTRTIEERKSSDSPNSSSPSSSKLKIDIERMAVFYGQWALDFTPTEIRILHLLERHGGKVCTRDFILDTLPGDHLENNDRSVDAHIKRIRHKLRDAGADPIKTVRGVGYKYEIN